MIWGEERFVGEDMPAALEARIAAEAARIAASAWLGLGPAAGGLRWSVRVTAGSARQAVLHLDTLEGGPRAPVGPFLVARLVSTPRDPALARRDRASRHAPARLQAGGRLSLLLQDWYFVPAGSAREKDILLPQFVLLPEGSEEADRWILEIGGLVVLEDGLITTPVAVDVEAGRIGWSGRSELWHPSRGFDFPEEGGPFGQAPLRLVGTADRMAPNPRSAKGASIRLKAAKYYLCPHCRNRTRVVPLRLAPDAEGRTPPSTLPKVLADRLDAFHPVRSLSYDFRCARCERPVRVLYEWSEIGMGGPWHPVVTGFVETDA